LSRAGRFSARGLNINALGCSPSSQIDWKIAYPWPM
jgi:hypothetical protein